MRSIRIDYVCTEMRKPTLDAEMSFQRPTSLLHYVQILEAYFGNIEICFSFKDIETSHDALVFWDFL